MCMIGQVVAVHDIPRSKPLIVYRAFGIAAEYTRAPHYVLRPVAQTYMGTWGDPDEIAVSHRLPGARNFNGLWAFLDPDQRDREFKHNIRGTVAVWGRVVEHEDGVRAEFAQVLELDVPVHMNPYFGDDKHYQRFVGELRETYHLTTHTPSEGQ